MIRRFTASIGVMLLAGSTLVSPALAASPHAGVSIKGAGSSFDFPFFDSAFRVYGAKHNTTIDYSPVGSGAGIQQFIAKTVDFGATDVPMDPTSDLKKAIAAGGPVQQIPIALGGVAIAFNVSGVKTGLHLSGPIVADIYLGLITKWNDKAIRKLNPKVKLPDQQITPVYRSDGSGTSYIFTDYLSKVSDTWRGKVGVGKLPQWPTGVGQAKNQGVAETVRSTSGAIGYVELAYVLQNHMHYAAMQNRANKFVLPNTKSIAADAKTFKTVSARSFSIVNGSGAGAYPIAGYSWVLLFQHQSDKAKGKALVGLMTWMLGPGQKIAGSLDYVPLTKNVIKIGVSALKTVR